MTRRLARRRGHRPGVALLLVVSTIAVMAIVVVEFSSTARTHLNQGVNLRDQARASMLADTALVMTRACLDGEAWGPFAAMRNRLDVEKLCNLMLGIFVRGRVDLPLGGLSVELDGIEGIGIGQGQIEDIKLTPEDAFVGLAGLHCANAANRPGGPKGCPSQRATINRLRSLLCDPAIAHVFETEHADGQRYTREEIIANLVDWVDPDDQRSTFDLEGNLVDSASEGEDAYYARMEDRYRVKDAPFDSIEELRLIRGINDELFEFLRKNVSVHSAGRVDVNTAPVDVLAATLRSYSTAALPTETFFCGEELAGGPQAMTLEQYVFRVYAQLLAEVRQFRQMNISRALAKPFGSRGGKALKFSDCAKDPLSCWIREYGNSLMGMAAAQSQLTPAQLLEQRLGPEFFQFFSQFPQNNPLQMDFNGLERGIRYDTQTFRLEAIGRVGNMTRRVFAVLKQEPKYVRTLYYRED